MMNTLMVVVVHETDIELISRLDRGKFVYEVCVATFDSFNRYSAGGTLELALESFTTRVNMELKKNINKLKKGETVWTITR